MGRIMEHEHKTISLGFTDQSFSSGVHICQIFSDEKERDESLKMFLVSGLRANEQTACFSEKVNEEELSLFFNEHNISYSEVVNSGLFSLSPVKEVYFKEDRFDPERMLELLKNYYESSVADGRSAARVIGEMSSDVEDIEGGSRLLEYESRVSLLLETHPITAVCQYDSNTFSGSMIMDILKVHPLMIVRGSVVRNPFFIPPEEFLANHNENG